MAEQEFPKFLRQKREAANLSQKEVADKLGYTTPQFISNWERGLAAPPIPALKKLGKLYGVPEKVLFTAILDATIARVTNQLKRKFKHDN